MVSGNEHEGQIKGAQPVDGKYGGALTFDGTDDAVTVPHGDDLTLSSFTIAAWFNCAGPNDQWQGIAGKDSWPVRNHSLYIHRDTKTLGSNFAHDANPDAYKTGVLGLELVLKKRGRSSR